MPSVEQIRQSMQGIGMTGALGMTSSMRPIGVPSNQLRPSQSSLKPQTTSSARFLLRRCSTEVCCLPALSAIHHSILLYDDMREWVEAKSELQQERNNFWSLTLERESVLKDVLRQGEELSI
ncbi:hypothetical protein ACS0TY_018801 [Phlomoides rotata]